VNIPPRAQISPLGVRVEVKNGPLVLPFFMRLPLLSGIYTKHDFLSSYKIWSDATKFCEKFVFRVNCNRGMCQFGLVALAGHLLIL
jgi:hypothetical protein